MGSSMVRICPYSFSLTWLTIAAKVVELRRFAGLGHETVAEVLGVSVYLARQKWAYARAWLKDVLTER